MATSSPMVSLRHVVAIPIISGLYCFRILSRARFRLTPPPNMAVSSEKFVEAISTGSLKWLITYRRIYVEHPCEPCKIGTAFEIPLKTSDAPRGVQSLQAFVVGV